MRSQRLGTLLGAGTVLGLSAARAQTPRQAKAIPLYPGAAFDTIGGKTGWSTSKMGGGGQIESANFWANAHIGAVLRFYSHRLHAAPGAGEEGAPDTAPRAPSAASPVGYQLTFHEFDDKAWTTEHGDSYRSFAKDERAALASARPADEDGNWIEEAVFNWDARAPSGELSRFSLILKDDDLAEDAKPTGWNTYLMAFKPAGPRTYITVDVNTAPLDCGAAQGHEELEALCEHRVTERGAALQAHPPSTEELGVPPYPGANFDGRNSAGMSSEKEKYFIYTTGNPADKVVAYYERATGKKALRNEGGALIAVRGEAPFPELGVAVQTNAGMYPAPVKTIITIRRATP